MLQPSIASPRRTMRAIAPLIAMALTCFAWAAHYTGTFADESGVAPVLVHGADGGLQGQLTAGGSVFGVGGLAFGDTPGDGMLHDGERSYAFTSWLSPDGSQLTLEVVPIDASGRPTGSAPVTLRLARQSVEAVPPQASARPATPAPPGTPAPSTSGPATQTHAGGIAAGSRITFYASSASVRGSYQQAVWKPGCDPSVEDCWIDPDSGRTIGQEEIPGAGGHGFSQLDILYADGQVCVGRITSYGVDAISGSISTLGVGAFATSGGSCSDFWVHPEQLRRLPVQNTPSMRVLHGPYTAGGRTFEAVSIGTYSEGASSQSTYDVASGFLMVGSTRTVGASVPVINPGAVIGAGAGNTMLTFTQFVGARRTAIAGAEPLPDRVRRLSRLSYGCVQTTGMQGAGAYQNACSYEVEVVDRGDAWSMLRVVLRLPNAITGTSDVHEYANVLAVGDTLGYYVAPSHLQRLQGGTVLDEDPVTGYRTTVARVDDDLVVILEEGRDERKQHVYDRRSGWMVGFVMEQRVGMAIVTTQLELMNVQ